MLLNSIFELISGDTPIYIIAIQLLFQLVALLLVFPVHEYAHGWVAHLFGDDTAKAQGRLTLNPMAHIDLQGFLLLLILGFGWAKPVQIDSRYFKNRRLGVICTSAAGPVSNVLFCFISYLLYGILSVYASIHDVLWLSIVSMLFFYMAIYNATFAVFNMIPFPPLDGSKILGELLPFKLRYKYYNLERYSFFFFIALIVVLNRTDILAYLSSGLLRLFTPLLNLILGGIFG